ncbi:MAG TPA: AsmA family protein [Gammaproteobacteria bacterium]|nr:AsmA family protein [Gammaproteobacteria bacterium]
MGKILRTILYLAGALAALLLVAAVVLPLVVDPNAYKDDITALVQEKTGRQLDIEGELALSVFPWLGVEIGPTRLGNAPGFGKTPFAEVKQVQVRVRLLSLLRGRLEMDTLLLDGLRLNLARNKRGVNNWDDLAAAAGGGPAQEQGGEGGGEALAGFALGGIRIVDASLTWDDRQSGAHYSIAPVSLETGAIEPGRPVDVSLKVGLESDAPPLAGDIRMKTQALVSASMQQVELRGTRIDIDLGGEGVPGGQLQAGLTLDAALDLAAETATLSSLVARLDDSTLKGKAAVNGFARPAIRFEFALDDFDLDRYLPAQEPRPATPAAAPAAGAGALPVETLRGLDVDGSLTIGKLKAFKLHSSDIALKLRAKNGLIRLAPASAKLYQGRYAGDMQMDVRGRQPKLSMNESLSGVQIGPLLKDLTGEDKLSGNAELKSKLNMRGDTPEAMTRTLNGNVAFAFTDGAIKGIDLPALIREARAVIKGEPAPAETGPQQTDFTELKGTATITDGIIDNRDLLARSPLLRVAGEGRVDLPRERIDYLLKVRVIGSLKGQGAVDKDLEGVEIPVEIGGSFTRPSYKVRLDKVLKKAVKKKAKKKLKKKLEKKLEKLEPGLQDTLKGLFKR